MTFDSIQFLIFFAVVFTAWAIISKSDRRIRNGFLLLASYFFYGYWSPPFVTLLLLSTVVDFYVARAISQSGEKRKKKLLLTFSIIVNLGILGFFKYFNFFIDSAVMLLPADSFVVPALYVILPVGISFYTFQSMSYSIDVYRGTMKASDSLLDVALYVAFFPQLVAGPIERASHMLPQFAAKPRIDIDRSLQGLDLIFRGYFKKIVIADNVAPLVNFVFSDVDSASSLSLWIGAYAFAIQIYADFSAYSDIARGVSKLLGFELMENFRAPYRSLNVSEFWKRWHISLSTWLRDYLYIPLGGNKGSKFKQMRNLFLVMALGGLWHGAAWNFVLWGLFHGILLIIYHVSAPSLRSVTENFGATASSGFRILSWFLTFHLVCISWVLFRVQSVADISVALSKMLLHPVQSFMESGLVFIPNAAPGEQLFYVVLILGALIAQSSYFEKQFSWAANPSLRGVRSALSLVFIFILYPSVKEQFIYFQF